MPTDAGHPGVSMRLSIDRLSKRYRSGVQALSEFTMELGPGVHGLLGPNGAGKSTLMRILATVLRPSGGRATWNGADIAREPDRLRAELGYLPQDFGVYPNLNPVEFLGYIAAAKGLDPRATRERIDILLELVNLVDARKRPLGGFSGGMRQRVGIAQALLNDPRLLIVDEPTAGLDPEERVRFRQLLSDLSGERVVILSTHIVSDVEAVASTIALIARGRLLVQGTTETLLRSLEGRVWEWLVPAQDLASVRARHLVTGLVRRGDGVQVRLVAESAPDPAARRAAPSLEEVYLAHMGAAREGEAREAASRAR
jgi:ABC-type multidrug transport system ATPase subunit